MSDNVWNWTVAAISRGTVVADPWIQVVDDIKKYKPQPESQK